jgi:hypothetical protein
VNQVWSVAGDDRREDVNQMFLQPFLGVSGDENLDADDPVGINR